MHQINSAMIKALVPANKVVLNTWGPVCTLKTEEIQSSPLPGAAAPLRVLGPGIQLCQKQDSSKAAVAVMTCIATPGTLCFFDVRYCFNLKDAQNNNTFNV